ncbi:MAG: hypothetical protein O3A19_04015 [Planctomycetota bacterium]|jgi:hypothetical protein|nr:hypothetical protein [Planctomycetota bacterium]MDA1025573.1 hypothetical protein [Planctomycetota bacterium]
MSHEASASASLLTHQDADFQDPRIRETIIAAARGIAERTGVELDDVACESNRLTIRMNGSTLMAIGLRAEWRRSTDHWHFERFGSHLWMAGPGDDWPRDADDYG